MKCSIFNVTRTVGYSVFKQDYVSASNGIIDTADLLLACFKRLTSSKNQVGKYEFDVNQLNSDNFPNKKAEIVQRYKPNMNRRRFPRRQEDPIDTMIKSSARKSAGRFQREYSRNRIFKINDFGGDMEKVKEIEEEINERLKSIKESAGL